MWSPRPGRRTLAGQFLVLQLAVVALVLVIVGVLSFQQATRSFEDDRGARLRSAAEYLANVAVVRDRVGSTDAARELAPAVDRAVSLSGADVASVVDRRGEVVASTRPALVGTTAALGDSRVLEGRGWTGSVTTDRARVLTGHAPVLDDEGTFAGAVLVEQTYPSSWQRASNAAPDLALFLGVGAGLGILGSWAVSRIVRRRTRGLGTRDFARLADHRQALLHSIREGVLGLDPAGRVTMVNDAALELLGLHDASLGRSVGDLGLEPHLAQLLVDPADASDLVVVTGQRVLVLNRRRAATRDEGVGSVVTMRDRTELVAVQQQLGSNLSITDALRAQTHEFANQLHTISGLLELDEPDEARALVTRIVGVRADRESDVADHVEDPATAALLIAKSSQADEAGVLLEIAPDCEVPPLPTDLSADTTTILGNLVDNAIDACRGRTQARVRLDARADDTALVIEVEDSGDGVPRDLRETVFVRGFSTKPEVLGGRGIGLALVRLLCERRGGSVTIDEARPSLFRVVLPWESS
ncbi:MAG: ATP-binding protein [Aeromicrobium sp.]|uniref:ATP-binding protein n=1 Tax=Aeromicrobium sp. TaxID=1871063 RepID=UPI00403484D5